MFHFRSVGKLCNNSALLLKLYACIQIFCSAAAHSGINLVTSHKNNGKIKKEETNERTKQQLKARKSAKQNERY